MAISCDLPGFSQGGLRLKPLGYAIATRGDRPYSSAAGLPQYTSKHTRARARSEAAELKVVHTDEDKGRRAFVVGPAIFSIGGLRTLVGNPTNAA